MMPSSCCALVAHDGVRGQRGDPAANRQQRGHAGGGIVALNCAIASLGQALDLGAARHAAPRRVHSVEEIPRGGLARERPKRLDPRPRGHRASGRRRIPASCAWRGCGRRSRRTIRPIPDRRRRRRASARRSRCLAATAGSRPAGADVVKNASRLPRRQLARVARETPARSPASLKASTARTADAV